MAGIILRDIVTTVRHELRMHLSNVPEVVFNLHVLIGTGAGYNTDHVRHNLGQRYLERRDIVMRIDNIEVNFGQHFELVPLPKNGAPVVFSDKRDQVLSFGCR